MRFLALIFVAMMAFPAAADDGFSLGLTELDFSTEPATENSPRNLSELSLQDSSAERSEVLAFTASLKPRSPSQRTEALWNSDLGRVYSALAAERAMLGREGLVNGGRMAGLGMATAGIGDGDPNGALGMALGRGRWAEMNANQKLQAGVEASILGALLAFMVSYAD